MIEQILEYNIVAEFLFMIQLVNLPPSAHTITFSAHCSKSPVHTAATLSGSNTIQYIQCTFEPPQGKPIPLLAYLQNSQQTLMVDCSSPLDEEDWLIIAVQDVNE